ncbi:MAG: hypothetical protein J2P52_15105 [Blastocatellia bacterium]|nr:hypothetical protein [Blastocatellia bacterium]
MESAKEEIWLILRAQAGDREAFDRLFRLLQEPLYRYIFSLTGARAMAEDILQEVFLLIYRKIRWLREPELLRPWVYYLHDMPLAEIAEVMGVAVGTVKSRLAYGLDLMRRQTTLKQE